VARASDDTPNGPRRAESAAKPCISTVQETFISHLIELRDRLLRAAIAWIVLFVCLFPFANDLYSAAGAAAADPSCPQGGQMIATEVVTPFFVPIKVAMMTAFLGALPYILYQVWAFIAPGLYSHERRLILPLVAASVVLFACGMAFAYFLVFPVVFGFIVGIAPGRRGDDGHRQVP
jgi:sec-independent protein translocase protein TatC